MDDIRKLIDAAWQTWGGCDILVNNAGMEKEADFWEVTEADYDKVLAVNLKGPFFLTQYFVQKLLAADKPGRVINISSVHEDMVFPRLFDLLRQQGRHPHADARSRGRARAEEHHRQQHRTRGHQHAHEREPAQ